MSGQIKGQVGPIQQSKLGGNLVPYPAINHANYNLLPKVSS
jgi:hypothetical protein